MLPGRRTQDENEAALLSCGGQDRLLRAAYVFCRVCGDADLAVDFWESGISDAGENGKTCVRKMR